MAEYNIGEFEEIEDENNAIDDLPRVLASLNVEGDDAIVMKVYKNSKGKRHWLFDALPDDAETIQERLRDDYKGGDFEVWIRRGSRIAKRLALSIEPPPFKPTDPVKPESNDMALVIMQGMNGLGQAISELGKLIVDNRQEHRQTPMEMQSQMMAMMLQMKEFLGPSTPANNGDDLKKFLEGINFAKDMALGENPQNDPSPGQVMMTLAEKLAPTLEAAFNNKPTSLNGIPQRPILPAGQRPMVKPKIMQPTPGVVPHPKPAPQPQKENQDVNFMLKMAIKNQLNQLVQFAAADRDPEIYANVVLDAVPEAYAPKFAEFILKPNAVEEMASLSPAVNQHREWFNELHQIIVEMLTMTDDDAINPEEENQQTLENGETDKSIDADTGRGGGNAHDVAHDV